MTDFFTNKNISITGGEGFLGQYLERILEKKIIKIYL